MAGDQQYSQSGNAPPPVVTKILYSQVIGSPDTFELETDIKIFFSWLCNFFGANSITDETKKKAVLLSSLSEDTQAAVQFVLTNRIKQTIVQNLIWYATLPF